LIPYLITKIITAQTYPACGYRRVRGEVALAGERREREGERERENE